MEGIGEDRGGRGRSEGRLLILGISCRVLLKTSYKSFEIAILSRDSFCNFPVEILASAEDGGAVVEWED